MFSVGEIKEILKRERISISKRRGQNFLVEPGLQKRIIQAVDIKPSDHILEIGPGLGALTEDLAQRACCVWAVEKDAGLVRILRRNFSANPNLKVIHADILRFKLEELAGKRVKVVGNLPYYITSPIIGYLLEEKRRNIQEIFITVQDEVGKRMLARPQTKDYSALSILVQYFTQARRLFSIPKRAFYPQPKVNSVFIHLQMRKDAAVQPNSQAQFFKIVRTCFNQRRKTILNSLTHKSAREEKLKIEQALQEAGIDCGLRPEVLSLAEFAQIEDVFYKRRIKLD